MVTCLNRTPDNDDERAHVERFERLQAAHDIKGAHPNVCVFGACGCAIKMGHDEGLGMVLYVHRVHHGMVRILPEGWNVNATLLWLRAAFEVLEQMDVMP